MFQKWWNFSLAPRHYQAQFHAFKFFFSSFGRNRGARKGATIVHNDHDYRARFTIKHNYELHFRFMLATGNRTCSRDLVPPPKIILRLLIYWVCEMLLSIIKLHLFSFVLYVCLLQFLNQEIYWMDKLATCSNKIGLWWLI